jgi:hypothetical protein
MARLLARGHTDAQIAAALGLPEPAVREQTQALIRAHGLASRGQLAVWAMQQDLLRADLARRAAGAPAARRRLARPPAPC